MQGWKKDGEWPPKGTGEGEGKRGGDGNGDGEGGGRRAVRRSVGRVRRVLGLGAGHGNDGMGREEE